MIPAWLVTALRERRLSVHKAKHLASRNARDYILIVPLDEAIAFQNLMVSAVLAHEEGELDQYNFDALAGASNRLADLIEDPVEISYERLYPSGWGVLGSQNDEGAARDSPIV